MKPAPEQLDAVAKALGTAETNVYAFAKVNVTRPDIHAALAQVAWDVIAPMVKDQLISKLEERLQSMDERIKALTAVLLDVHSDKS